MNQIELATQPQPKSTRRYLPFPRPWPCGDHFEIELSRGLRAQVDADAVEDLDSSRWMAAPSNVGPNRKTIYYARRTYRDAGGKKRQIFMHRQIMGFPDGIVDHIDGNTLNNRRSNLRIVTATQSTQNTSKHVDNKTGYKGVSRTKEGRYRVCIQSHGKRRYYMTFFDPIEAAEFYDEKAREVHGEYARTNFVPL